MPTCGHTGFPAVPEDDPLRVRSAAVLRGFEAYLRWYIRRQFDAVRVARAGLPRVPEGHPVIIYSNHPGWWDPMLFILLARWLLPERASFGPMDAAALKKYPVLRKVGVFGIDPDSQHGARRFLEVGARILARPDRALWVTAQGSFTDPRQRPVRLRPGISHLARRVPNLVLLPLALEYPFWNERQPEALARFGEPVAAGPERSTREWTALLEAALQQTCDILAQESMARDPARFEALLRGHPGVGGVYDLWRRGAAMFAGRRFDPSHEGQP